MENLKFNNLYICCILWYNNVHYLSCRPWCCKFWILFNCKSGRPLGVCYAQLKNAVLHSISFVRCQDFLCCSCDCPIISLNKLFFFLYLDCQNLATLDLGNCKSSKKNNLISKMKIILLEMKIILSEMKLCYRAFVALKGDSSSTEHISCRHCTSCTVRISVQPESRTRLNYHAFFLF